MHLFYLPSLDALEPDASGARASGAGARQVRLEGEQAHHATAVLRLRVGQPVQLTDGRGTLAAGVFEGEGVVRILERVQRYNRRPYRLHIALAPTKNSDRYEWFLEKATEIGVDRITPVLCARSERKAVKRERGEKILLSAMRQSGGAYLPRLDELTPLPEFLAGLSDQHQHGRRQRFIGYVDPQMDLGCRRSLFDALEPAIGGGGEGLGCDDDGPEYTVLIGPEGDFSPAEVQAACGISAEGGGGFVPVSLGGARLRTETAGVVVAATAALRNGNVKSAKSVKR